MSKKKRNLPAAYRGGLPSRLERKAGNEIVRARAYGAVVAARQHAKAAVIGDVTRTAIREFSDIAVEAEIAAQRTPGFAPEADGLARQGAMALGQVIRETERLW